MVHSHCSASFADAVGPVSSARGIAADNATARGVAAVRADAAAVMPNSAGERSPGDTG